MEKKSLSPAANQGLRQIVYEKLRAAIVDGVLPPGSKLSEIELAEQMAVSRTPVREAIRQLAQTGLVTLSPRKGAFVTLPSLKDASDLYELRIALEILAVENLSVDPPVEELKRFRSVFASMTDTTPAAEYVKEDHKFHAALYQSGTNRFLTLMLKNISDLINLCRSFSVERSPITAFTSGHLEIIDALISGDGAKAAEETRKHITVSKEALLAYLNNGVRRSSPSL